MVVASCTEADPGPIKSVVPPPTPPTPSIAPTTPVTSQLDPLTLTASLDEQPVSWTEVAFVPAGDAEDEIGIQPCYHCGEQLLPSALAVESDGSLWIADSYKRRIAHFSSDGSFLEAVPLTPGPADLTFVGDRLFVLPREGGTKVVPVGPGGPGEPITVNNGGKGLHVQALIGGQDDLVVMISGAQQLLGGYWAFATVDLATGQVMPSPGVRTATGVYADLQPVLGSRPIVFEIRWSKGPQHTSAQEVRFQLVRRGRELQTSVGDTYVRTATHWGIATVMSIAGGDGIPVGAWYLEFTPEGEGVVFERIPADGFIGNLRRYLTVGPGGRVYWMRLLEDGLHIYRR